MEVNKKIRIGAYGLIIRENKIALIKKARGGYKGLLDIPGGGIEHGESPEETLIREIKEEAGVDVLSYELLDVKSNRLVWHDEIFNEDLHQIGILYKVELKDYNLKKSGDGLDSDGCDFYDIDKLSKNDITPFTLEGLELLGYKISK